MWYEESGKAPKKTNKIMGNNSGHTSTLACLLIDLAVLSAVEHPGATEDGVQHRLEACCAAGGMVVHG